MEAQNIQTSHQEHLASRKSYIDFYKQQESHGHVQNRHIVIQQNDSQNESSQNPNNRAMYESVVHQQQQQSKATGHQLIQFQNNQNYEADAMSQEPSPIYGTQQVRIEPKSGNYVLDQGSSHNSSRGATEEVKRRNNERQVVANHSKRKSLENKDFLLKNNKPEVNQHRLSGQQVKSSLGNYGGQDNQIKMINKDNKIERDPVMENIQSQYNLTQQQKRTLAKSSSQNRLLLVSPESLMNKNGLYQEDHDKNSFLKDSQVRPQGAQVTDVMYKQHMQYSSNGQQNHHHKNGWTLKTNNHNNMILSRLSTNNCTFCNKTNTAGIHSNSLIPPHHCSAIYCSKDQQGFMIQKKLSERYSTNRDYYNLKIVNDLIYNENTHIVSIFKDYLILDDINEFLKRSYTQPETKTRLPKLCSFYDKYSQVFPNYVVLPESKYMFKNIQRKQKLIDEQYQLQEMVANKQHQTLLDEDKLFNTKFYNSYYSMMGNDISMTKKQYEEQAKQISLQAGRKPPARIDQMRIDELVDRFLMKDSESNIQLITTAGLDFSGFTHQSTFINNPHDVKLPSGQKTNQQQTKTNAQNNLKSTGQQQQIQSKVTNTVGGNNRNTQQSSVNNAVQARKKASVVAPYQPVTQTSQQNNNSSSQMKKQKGSFNNNNHQQAQSKVSNYPASQNQNLKINAQNTLNRNEHSSSTKTTPRLQKTAPASNTGQQQNTIGNNMILDSQSNHKMTIQTSPATKEAIQSYLQCQIDPSSAPVQSETLGIKSPTLISQKQLQLIPSGSQSSLNAMTHLSLSSTGQGFHTRQNMKSQQNLLIPSPGPATGSTLQSLGPNSQSTLTQIANLKKTTRLSHGGNTIQSKQPLTGTTTMKKNTSPVPQILSSQVQSNTNFVTSASRNQLMVNNSTQKSTKSINSHAKYLSGGADQYQKILSTINQQNNFETVNSASKVSSQARTGVTSQKKQIEKPVLQQQKAIHQHQQQNIIDQDYDNDLITGEDCDDFGIADERFASPDNKLVFQTIDDLNGRKSIEGLRQQQLLLTSSEDKILSQCNNFDQIKKHLEQYITLNNSTGTGQSYPMQQTFDSAMATGMSNNKKLSLGGSGVGAQVFKSIDNNEMKQSIASTGYQQNMDPIHSRNGQGQMHFESLKSKVIKNVYDQPDTQSISSANKTPNKSLNQKKSNVSQNLAALQQNRMSIESRGDNIMIMGPGTISQDQGCLSSTSAVGNQRQLSFSQNSFNNSSNYRSTANIQQKRNSNYKQANENSIENKRMSGQHNRQSFKDLQTVATAYEAQKVMKRCTTSKTLNIQEINTHTFGAIQAQNAFAQQQFSNTGTLCNPTFIQSTANPNNKLYNTHHQQQNSIGNSQTVQQAANTVRVMTPSYSLASLSKVISPTQSTSPLTMTVSGLQHTNSRKQLANPSMITSIKNKDLYQNNTMKQQQPSHAQLVSSRSHQNFMLNDKNTKVINSSNKQGNIHRAKGNTTGSGQFSMQQQQMSNTMYSKQSIKSQINNNQMLIQSNSLSNLQITPRGGQLTASVAQVQQEQMQHLRRPNQPYNLENSQNMSCTISTENNSSNYFRIILYNFVAAKAIETKNPKFMKTIEEAAERPLYNNMLSQTLGNRSSGIGLTTSVSQAQFDTKNQKHKIQTVVNSNTQTIKRQSNQMMMTNSNSVTSFKSPTQQIQTKKNIHTRYGNI